MAKKFDVRWQGELRANPREVWNGLTVRTARRMWTTEYEPRVGGAERGPTAGGGTVVVWDPQRRFVTRAEGDGDGSNELDYLLEPHGAGTHLRQVHRGVITEDYDRQLDACRQHTEFYFHSLGEYPRHFSGRDPAQVAADAPKASAQSGLAALCWALGVAEDVAVRDHVVLTPAGLEQIDGIVDYATHTFLGVRSADALYRLYSRDAWGWPVGMGHHLFARAPTRRRVSGPGRVAGRRLRDRGGGVMAPSTQCSSSSARRLGTWPTSRRRSCMPTGSCPSGSQSRAGRIVAGMALEQSGTATAIRGDLVTDGPFIETKEALTRVFVMEARDLDHALALALAKLTPIVDGSVEVRPLLGFDIVEAS